MTSLFPLDTEMASCSGESVEAVERMKGFWWSIEDTAVNFTMRIQGTWEVFGKCQYNCKKKSVWEMIAESMATENPTFSPRPEQVEGNWKSLTLAFRKCCDHNCISGKDRKEWTFYREIGEFCNYACVRPYATGSSSERADWKISSLLWAYGFCCLKAT